MNKKDDHQAEVELGKRFAFGINWKRFLKLLTNERIGRAQVALQRLLKNNSIKKKTFIDIGSGSGINSLVAHQMGASVISFDYDPDSVDCTNYVKSKSKAKDSDWKVMQGSVLDERFMSTISPSDVVYSWGVLHHTGEMWNAIENASSLVKKKGLFILAIYNRHWSSPTWRLIKMIYNFIPNFLKKVLIYTLYPIIYIAKLLTTQKNPFRQERGMDFFYDVIDWVGGYPYEYASKDEVESRLKKSGFKLLYFYPPVVPTGCNEFVFEKL